MVCDAGLDDGEVVSIWLVLVEVGGGMMVLCDELIGPSLGDELCTKVFVALGIVLVVQLLYLLVCFCWIFVVVVVVVMF